MIIALGLNMSIGIKRCMERFKDSICETRFVGTW